MVLGVSTFMIKATGHVPSTKLLVTHLKCQPMILQLTSGVCILISIGTDIAGPSCLLFIGFTCGHHVFRAQSPSAKGGAPGGTKAKERGTCAFAVLRSSRSHQSVHGRTQMPLNLTSCLFGHLHAKCTIHCMHRHIPREI